MLKEANELLDGIELLAVEAKKIAKDGISVADLPEAVVLLSHIDVIVKAVQGVGEVGHEVREATEAELIALGMRVFSIAKAVKSA